MSYTLRTLRTHSYHYVEDKVIQSRSQKQHLVSRVVVSATELRKRKTRLF